MWTNWLPDGSLQVTSGGVVLAAMQNVIDRYEHTLEDVVSVPQHERGEQR